MAKVAERVASENDLRGRKLYILYVLYRTDNIWSRPRAVLFADVSDVFRHIGDLVSHQLINLNEKLRRRIVTALEMQDFQGVGRLYRRAQLENREALTMDFYWDDKPTVIM